MQVDTKAFRQIVDAALGSGAGQTGSPAKLAQADASALMAIMLLAVDADDREDSDELSALAGVRDGLAAAAGIAAGALPKTVELPRDDDQRLEMIRVHGAKLSSQPVRDLAFALTYLVSISDLDLAPEEADFLEDLAAALGVADDRADDLAIAVGEAITPPED